MTTTALPENTAEAARRRAWGARLAEARARARLTQEELAAKANVTQQAISSIESGQRGMSDSMRVKIASALSRNPDRLFPLSVNTT